jgi:hypothetical protein
MSARQNGDALPQRLGPLGCAGQEKPGGWLRRAENFDGATELAGLVRERNHRDFQWHCAPIERAIHGGKIVDTVEFVVESEREGTGIIAVGSASGQLAPATDLLSLLVAQETSSGIVDMKKTPLSIENDNRFAKIVENLDPGVSYEIFRVADHAFINNSAHSVIRGDGASDRLPTIPSTFDLEALLGFGFRIGEVERSVSNRQKHDVGLPLDGYLHLVVTLI